MSYSLEKFLPCSPAPSASLKPFCVLLQEVESRLTVVTKDLSVVRGSLAAVTSKAEAAEALSASLQEELTRTSEDMRRTAGQAGALSTEVSTCTSVGHFCNRCTHPILLFFYNDQYFHNY